VLAAAAWSLSALAFTWRRVAPGPRSAGEVVAMLLTSIAIPPVAVAHRAVGAVRARGARLHPARQGPPAAVLFDRDGTLVVDVPYNGDPARVEPVPGARRALDRLRAAGIPLALVSNQSGVARGLLTLDDVAAVNERVAELLGPFDAVLVCPHGSGDGCRCRKPAPGMVLDAASLLGVPPDRCALVGDIGSDVGAALAAGARAVLVPTGATLPVEVAAAPEVAADLSAAVDLLLASGATP
jgi:histidinol-phosphate phosphatase family protein